MPLYLLDTELEENDPVDRWITARLYEGNPLTRLGQYGLLGIGTVRALRALGIEPGVLHFNEGHPALAALELAAEQVAAGEPLDDALAAARERCVFTTHTPVPAGNETYETASFLEAFADLPARLGIDAERFLDLCRTHPASDEWPGMTPLALRPRPSRERRSASATARWRARCGGRCSETYPPTTCRSRTSRTASTCRRSSPRRCAPCSTATSATAGSAAPPTPRPWAPVEEIPDEELWAARNEARRLLVDYVKDEERPGPAAARRGSGERQGGRRDVRRGHADARLRPADRDVQAPLPAHVRPGARAADLRRRPAAPDGRRGQGAPARRQREADARRRLRALAGGRDHVARRVPRELRPLRRRADRRRLRRVDQRAAPAARGERDERDEVGRERRAQPERARRLVGRGLRRARTAGRSTGPRTRARTRRRRTRATRTRCTTCSSSR